MQHYSWLTWRTSWCAKIIQVLLKYVGYTEIMWVRTYSSFTVALFSPTSMFHPFASNQINQYLRVASHTTSSIMKGYHRIMIRYIAKHQWQSSLYTAMKELVDHGSTLTREQCDPPLHPRIMRKSDPTSNRRTRSQRTRLKQTSRSTVSPR